MSGNKTFINILIYIKNNNNCQIDSTNKINKVEIGFDKKKSIRNN